MSLQRAQDVTWHHVAAAIPAVVPDTDVETEEAGSSPGNTLCKLQTAHHLQAMERTRPKL